MNSIEIEKIASSVSQMVKEYMDGGIRLGTDWKNGLTEVIRMRLNRFLQEPAMEVIQGLLRNYDEDTGMIDVRPTPSCPICTQGVTPDSMNKGPCFYNQALQLLT